MVEILLIEDDDLLREHLRIALEDKEYAVQEACNGKQGLKFFDAKPADIVITDLVMDEGEGMGTIMSLRETSTNTPLIAISGNPLYLQHASKMGIKQALLKPFTTAALFEAIDVCMRSSQIGSA
jgi:DNA-binding response OmpR family regulator